jgi:hypothetical protein
LRQIDRSVFDVHHARGVRGVASGEVVGARVLDADLRTRGEDDVKVAAVLEVVAAKPDVARSVKHRAVDVGLAGNTVRAFPMGRDGIDYTRQLCHARLGASDDQPVGVVLRRRGDGRGRQHEAGNDQGKP